MFLLLFSLCSKQCNIFISHIRFLNYDKVMPHNQENVKCSHCSCRFQYGMSYQCGDREIAWWLASLSATGPSRFAPGSIRLFQKGGILSCVIGSFPPVLTTRSKKAIHVSVCLCTDACKRSLDICRKSRV